MPVILIDQGFNYGQSHIGPFGHWKPREGTVKDTEDNPLVRQIVALRNDFTNAKDWIASTTSNAAGSFRLKVNEILPVTVIARGGPGENDKIFDDVPI